MKSHGTEAKPYSNFTRFIQNAPHMEIITRPDGCTNWISLDVLGLTKTLFPKPSKSNSSSNSNSNNKKASATITSASTSSGADVGSASCNSTALNNATNGFNPDPDPSSKMDLAAPGSTQVKVKDLDPSTIKILVELMACCIVWPANSKVPWVSEFFSAAALTKLMHLGCCPDRAYASQLLH